MIISPSTHEIEVRLLATVMSEPRLLAEIPDLETMDFSSLAHKTLWGAIVTVAPDDLSCSPPELRLLACECIRAVSRTTGGRPFDMLDMVALELEGRTDHISKARPPVLDDRILNPERQPLNAAGLKSAAASLRFARRALDHLVATKHPGVSQ